MAEVGGHIETSRSVYNGKSAFMEIQASQGQSQHHSGCGSPDGRSGFGSPAPGSGSSSYHHHVRLSPPPGAGYHHHMTNGPSPHHHHQQSQTDIPGSGFMSTNPSVQVMPQPKNLLYWTMFVSLMLHLHVIIVLSTNKKICCEF